jgi:hypothetical protein
MGFLTGAADPRELDQLINEAANGGYRFEPTELTVEPRRVLLFLQAYAINVVFRWDAEEPAFEYKVFTYQTRLFGKTVDVGKLTSGLNAAAAGGFEVYCGFKETTKTLGVIPRETYFFVLRRRRDGQNRAVGYRFVMCNYRLFTRTLDPTEYERVLNEQGGQSRHIGSFRDERRFLGFFKQNVALTLFEDPAVAMQPQFAEPQPQFAQPQPQFAQPAMMPAQPYPPMPAQPYPQAAAQPYPQQPAQPYPQAPAQPYPQQHYPPA